jgi:hypothetical protein
MSLDEMSLDKMSLDEMLLGETPLGETTLCEPTLHPNLLHTIFEQKSREFFMAGEGFSSYYATAAIFVLKKL